MSLFQSQVLKKYLALQNDDQVKQAFAQFTAHFHHPDIQQNIRASKEEQYQEGFLTDLFVNILGYIKNPTPNFNLTTELKNLNNAKKTDGAILKDGNALAVIELKGMDTTNLSNVENQAFLYKNNHPNCRYVIISNFQKLRFYIDNAVEFIEFELFSLDFEQFQILYLLLNAENLLRDLPAKIKSESLSSEDQITKQLYRDYSSFKRALFDNLVQKNPQFEPLVLFKKSQKLLDRFLFLFFGEDRGLLPPNSVRVVLDHWQELKEDGDYQPLYERFKKYFGWINTGVKGRRYDVFAYNGGLFKPDEVLDNVAIDDDILFQHAAKLADYDFDSEIDVNILGHIFENSLNELDEITAQLNGESVEKAQTKRKKDGVFYTPKYITQYIVQQTVGKLCESKKAEFQIVENEFDSKLYKLSKGKKAQEENEAKQNKQRALLAQLEAYRQWLLGITICDPACGSGAFLNEALNFLINEHRYLDELQAKLFGDTMMYQNVSNHILENNLYGVDINSESVDIAKLSLWLRTAEPNRKLSTLNNNLKCGNSLIGDPKIAGELAFNWQTEFPLVFANGGFDVVIGNPPYVNAKGENFSQIQKDFYYNHYQTAVYQIDTYILFIEKLKTLLKEDGVASYIVPNAWLNNLLLADVRKFVLENFQLIEIVNTPSGVFNDATVDTVIFGVKNNDERNKDVKISQANGNEIVFTQQTNQTVYAENKDYMIDIFSNHSIRSILEEMENNAEKLGDICDMASGIKEYQKGKGKPKQTEAEKLENRFNSTTKKDETFLPHLTGNNLNRYGIDWENQYLSYGEWLAEPRQKKYFEGERLIIREIPSKTGLVVAFTDQVYTVKNSAHICRAENPEFHLKFILSILNSHLMGFYFKYKFSEFDDVFPKAKIGQCKQLPIKAIPLTDQQPFIDQANKMLTQNAKLQQLTAKFLRAVERELGIAEPSKALQNWHTLDFTAFLKELTKKEVKLSLAQKAEWEDFFLAEQQKAAALQAEISALDRAIDQAVYRLYGLSEEEIAVVEGA